MENQPTYSLIPKSEKGLLESLMRTYFEELYPGIPANSYAYLDLYWTEAGRHAFKILLGEKIIGFVLVNEWVIDQEFNAKKSIAEFYIQPVFRRRGIGKAVARAIFEQFPGKWEVRQELFNKRGIAFWQDVIREFTKGNFHKKTLNWEGNTFQVQLFEAS